MHRLSVCIYSLFIIQSNLISIIYHLFTISSNLHVILYYFFIQKFYRNFYLRSHKIERNSYRTMLKQTKLFSLPKNQIKRKKKKKPRRRRRRRRVTRHVLRHLEKRRWCVETEKNPRGIPQGKRVAGSQGWHVPPRQNGRAKPV